MDITFFYIPVGSESEAVTLGHLAVAKRLAACANVFPIQSIYPWEVRIHHENEFVLVLKTVPLLKVLLQTLIEEHHSYDVPCILCWNVEVNELYGKWIEEKLEAGSSQLEVRSF